MPAVMTCTAELVAGQCPEGAAVWVVQSALTPAELAPLVHVGVGLLCIAAAARYVAAVIRSSKG